MERVGVVRFVVLAVAFASVASGNTTLLFDDFEDGDFTSGPTWYNIGPHHVATIVDDMDGLGTGNAVELNFTVNTSNANSSFFHSEFPEVTLENVGDFIELTFDVRFLADDPEVVKPSLFRYGFYDVNGTPGGDDFVLSQDGFGYFVQADIGGRDLNSVIDLRRNRPSVGMYNATFNPDTFGEDFPGVDELAPLYDDPHSVVFRIERSEDPFDQTPDLQVTTNIQGPGEEDLEPVVGSVLTRIGVVDTFTFGDVSIGTRPSSNSFGNDDWIIDNVMVITNLDVEIPGPDGDYDMDGDVDSNDYTEWKSMFGDAGTGLAADGNSDGIVNLADYTVWRDNLGAGSSAALVSQSVVPEPTTAISMVMLLGMFVWRSRSSSTLFVR